ncbi:MAG: phosphatase PAP2 family protein [Ktedonobacteraceae bacterium]|nr:phosphatase PAP2 family protein [Ktedonobacteraceae bacterium]
MQNQVNSAVDNAKKEVTTSRRSRYHLGRIGRALLIIYAVQLTLFALLAGWVYVNPVTAVDVAITQEFQENLAPWLQTLMRIVSYPGSSFVLPALIVLVGGAFWLLGLRLEGIVTLVLSGVSALLNALIKLIVHRPRPTAGLVEVLQGATGNSFPSGHVMAYLAFWGLLFSFGIILFHGWRWWRIALLIVPAFFVVMVGPSRIYLGAHWASDVLGSYLIGGVLLGITLGIYLKLKERGVLETERARRRAEKYSALRTFPVKATRERSNHRHSEK